MLQYCWKGLAPEEIVDRGQLEVASRTKLYSRIDSPWPQGLVCCRSLCPSQTAGVTGAVMMDIAEVSVVSDGVDV
jgi:hypothetical protein